MYIVAETAADARLIDHPDASADAVLLMGPFYHIVDAKERKKTLQESLRLLKPGEFGLSWHDPLIFSQQ